MSRGYGHISQYEKEILKMRENGLTYRAIGEKLGFTISQIEDFFTRYHQKQRKLVKEKVPKKKGRPHKDYIVTEDMGIQELKYIIARKDSKIKALEMENELMRDFLSLIERK